MSMADGRVSCTGCGFEGYLLYRPVTLIYRLSDGTEVESHRARGWCRQCENISDIEGKIDQEPLRTKLAELKGGAGSLLFSIRSALDKFTGAADKVKKEIAAINGLLLLAKIQGVRARCLTCGDENTILINFNTQGLWAGFVHSCGGHLKLEPHDKQAPRFSYRLGTIYLNEDGFRI